MIIILCTVSIDLYVLIYYLHCFGFLQTSLRVPVIDSLPFSSKTTHCCLFWDHMAKLWNSLWSWHDVKLCQQRAWKRQWGMKVFSSWFQGDLITSVCIVQGFSSAWLLWACRASPAQSPAHTEAVSTQPPHATGWPHRGEPPPLVAYHLSCGFASNS